LWVYTTTFVFGRKILDIKLYVYEKVNNLIKFHDVANGGH